MADTAAHLVDRVFPQVPVRQWVLSLPFALRYRLAYDASLVSDVLQIFVRALFASIRRRAGIPSTNRQARCGAVSFVQRFGDALNLNVHFHTLALDGIYIVNEDGTITFRHVAPPSDAEVARVTERICRRVTKLLERRPWSKSTLRKPIPCSTISRCSQNYTALLFPAGWRPVRTPAGGSRKSATPSIWRISPYPPARAVPQFPASAFMPMSAFPLMTASG